jgi:hypothetical protein
LKALGNWRFFYLPRYKTDFSLTGVHEKKTKKQGGGVQNVCNFVALWSKVNTTLNYRRYKMRYKKIFLSRCDYE